MSASEPVPNGLDDAFRLTSYLELKGSGCQVPESVVSEMFNSPAINGTSQRQETQLQQMLRQMSIDTCARGGGQRHHLRIECRYPIIDDPCALGKIICAEALGNFYALGITACDKMMMMACQPPQMSNKEFTAVFSMMETGFKECFKGTYGKEMWAMYMHTSCFMIGGLVSAYWPQHHLVARGNALDGDVLVLTKPLGTQVAIDAYDCIGQPERWERYKMFVSEEDVRGAYQQAVKTMCRLNRQASNLMHVHNAHGAMAVSGFGILHHANKLASLQKKPVSFVIDTLPVISKMAAAAKASTVDDKCPLLQGLSVETSGGLLICMPREEAVALCNFIGAYGDGPAWIIGTVQNGIRKASIIENVKIIEVSE
ncbi:inactive selenide, water dikinase-like protein [Drosophila pseudoobscura]|uniref:Inactive selenide, water dikinase-like protein n=1 Tax=Drosophila pseudoobscura pseudoobscura TaxID=46245 RepID=A0A6I8V019_DROPS|nr:inactive selenide, water dikinase-like protein [Drosophila pseudoobscura]